MGLDLGKWHTLLLLIIGSCISPLVGCAGPSDKAVRMTQVGEGYLVIEFLDDDLLHFEFGTGDTLEENKPIQTTPMILKTDYTGPKQVIKRGGHVETAELRVQFDPDALGVQVIDKITGELLTAIRANPVASESTELVIASPRTNQLYGLGEQFMNAGDPNGDWLGRKRTPGNEFGNALVGFNEQGAVGNAQFPIVYAGVNDGNDFALFVDNAHALTWDFSTEPWKLEAPSTPIRGYILTGPDLPDLRRDYMELVGRPPVPPLKMFGLWVSEYGYDNWAELDDKLAGLRRTGFPVDGFVLDLQWFGGIARGTEQSQMGSLTWDTTNFPDPAAKIRALERDNGVGIIVIEESYITAALEEHAELAKRGFLPRDADGKPIHMPSWWGKGSMVDWTNPKASAYWHDTKRDALIRDGVIGHWTDLGEPENFDENAFYHGVDDRKAVAHRDIHNLYNFCWSRGIHRGYARNQTKQRPFIMSRSGTSGTQRFGTGMWSGDIGARMDHLAVHFNVQMHMSFSGIDYFGSDIGGFHRWSLDGDLDELYTQWFANSAAIDVPVRPHTSNTDNRHQTSPHLVGDLDSNLANIRLRYALVPYLYSLAHRAWRTGDPVFPPPVHDYQEDHHLQGRGDQKLMGHDLLVATANAYGCLTRDVYLPAGEWIDFHTHARHDSPGGQWIEDAPLERDGIFSLPLYARNGAIIPMMHVDEQTMNVFGRRLDGTTRDELIVRVYASDSPSKFTLYEDDGRTIAYQSGAVRRTALSAARRTNIAHVRIAGSEGDYRGAADRRINVVELVIDPAEVCESVSLNGKPLEPIELGASLETGWYQREDGVVIAQTPQMHVGRKKDVVFKLKRR